MAILVALALVFGVVIGVVEIVVYLTVGKNLELYFPVSTALMGVSATIYWIYLYKFGGDVFGLDVGMASGLTIGFLYGMCAFEYFQKIWKWLNESPD